MPDEAEPEQDGDPAPPIWQIGVVVAVLAALVYVAVLAVIQIYPHQLPVKAVWNSDLSRATGLLRRRSRILSSYLARSIQ